MCDELGKQIQRSTAASGLHEPERMPILSAPSGPRPTPGLWATAGNVVGANRLRGGQDMASKPRRSTDPKTRPSTSKRTGQDRRKGADRRAASASAPAPERRSGTDRRSKARARTDIGNTAIIDWSADDPKVAKARERKRRQLAISVFLLVLTLAVGFEVYRLIQAAAPPKAQREDVSVVPEPVDPFQLIAEQYREDHASEFGKKRPEQVQEDGNAPTAARLREDLLNTAPGIFKGIRLQLTDGSSISGNDTSSPGLKAGSVRSIEIMVKSGSWDAVPSKGKVDLLKKTFDLLNSRYPSVTKVVQMTFDDGRKDLVLKFAPDVYSLDSRKSTLPLPSDCFGRRTDRAG